MKTRRNPLSPDYKRKPRIHRASPISALFKTPEVRLEPATAKKPKWQWKYSY